MQPVNSSDHTLDDVKAGVLYKRSRLGLFWKKRWVHASNGEISYSTDPVAPRAKNTISLDLATIQVKPSSRNRHRFEITTAIGQKYEFAAETSREVSDWIRFLRHQLLNRKSLLNASEGEPYSPDTAVMDPSSPGSPRIMPQAQQFATQNASNDQIDPNTGDIAWNDMYQSIIEQSDSTFDSAVSKAQSLNQLILDFVSASTRLSKIIIQEYTLPAFLKTIRPLDANDQNPEEETFMSEGIVFQYMQDPNGTDAQDELRRKTCTHDLHGIQAYANSSVKGLHTYLCCIVDFLGFRMFCLALVPIYDDSHICFGRVQGQYHIDTCANLMLEQAANELGLATHLVPFQEDISDRYPPEFVSIHSSSSLMVHKGEDQRMYVTSLTRAFPLDHQFPSKDEFSTRQLRPEFLRLYEDKLSPDAFIISGSTDSKECNNNLDKALHHLRSNCIADFVRELDYLHVIPVDSAHFTALFHSRGINVRYLGVIADSTTLPHVREMAVCEIVARCCKQILNQRLRKITRGLSSLRQNAQAEHNSDEPFALEKVQSATKAHMDSLMAACAESFCIFLSSSAKSADFWRTTLADRIQRKFDFKLTYEEGSCLHRPLLLSSFQYHCGIRLSESGLNCAFEKSFSLSASDISSFEPRCKWPVISSSKCSMFPLMAEQYMNDGEFDMAIQALRLKLDVILCHQSSMVTGTHTHISPLSSNSLPPPPPPPHLKGKSTCTGNEESAYSPSSVRVQASSTNISSVSCDIHSTLNDLCEAYIYVRDISNARLCAKKALEISRGQDARTSATYAHLGNIYQTSGQSGKADQCLKMSLSILKRLYGLHHPLIVRLLDDVGNGFIELGLYKSAEESLTKALELALISLGKTHPATAELYSSLGRLHQMKNDLDKAKEAYEKACLIYEGAYGAASAEVATSCSHLSDVMNRKGDSRLAKYYQDRMLKTRMQIDESTNAYFIE